QQNRGRLSGKYQGWRSVYRGLAQWPRRRADLQSHGRRRDCRDFALTDLAMAQIRSAARKWKESDARFLRNLRQGRNGASKGGSRGRKVHQWPLQRGNQSLSQDVDIPDFRDFPYPSRLSEDRLNGSLT